MGDGQWLTQPKKEDEYNPPVLPCSRLIAAFHPTPSTYRGFQSEVCRTSIRLPARVGTGQPHRDGRGK
jgi:hypothetical protein